MIEHLQETRGPALGFAVRGKLTTVDIQEVITALQRMIRRGDGQGLFDLFSRTRAIRRSIVEQGQETAAPDFGRRPPQDED